MVKLSAGSMAPKQHITNTDLIKERGICLPFEQGFGNLGMTILTGQVERSEARVVDAIDETVAV